MEIKESEFRKWIDDVCNIYEVYELRGYLENDEYEIENRLEMSTLVRIKECEYGID